MPPSRNPPSLGRRTPFRSSTRLGYHGVTYAWTVGQIVRLVSGMPLGTFFQQHVAGTLKRDFPIGLPESEEGRAATMQPGSLPNLFLTNLGGADFNLRAVHSAEIGSANGITNARGLASQAATSNRPESSLQPKAATSCPATASLCRKENGPTFSGRAACLCNRVSRTISRRGCRRLRSNRSRHQHLHPVRHRRG